MLFIAYYRVSTEGQGIIGLGMDAQRSLVRRFTDNQGEIVREFQEVESGSIDDRPELLKAIEFAKQQGARLVIAKLDRLSRSARFILTLRDSGVDFVCADMPDANTLTIGLLAVIAQHEREAIGSRTRQALQERKRRGLPMGTPANLTRAAMVKGALVMKEKARLDINNRRAAELCGVYQAQGKSLSWIVGKLNELGMTTRRGEAWRKSNLYRVWRSYGTTRSIIR